jgi:hypothetical protein
MTDRCKHNLKVLLHGSFPLKLLLSGYVSKNDQYLLAHSFKYLLIAPWFLLSFLVPCVVILLHYILNVFCRVEIIDFDCSHINQKFLITTIITERSSSSTVLIIIAVVIQQIRIQFNLGMEVATRGLVYFGEDYLVNIILRGNHFNFAANLVGFTKLFIIPMVSLKRFKN